MNFSEAVKVAMDKIGMTKADLAREMSCSDSHVGDLLKGDRRWNEDTISKACEALGIQVTFEQRKEVEDESTGTIE
jgi:ribosome-binding protein aMBF1 (putative translation factor)